MTKLLQIAAVLLSVTLFSTASAACPAYAKSQAEEFMQELQTKVSLTPEQQDAMEDIMVNSINQREDIIESYQSQGQKGMKVKKQIRDELQAVNATTRADVQEVLDEQQYQAFLEVQEERQEKVRERINSEF